MPEHDQTDVRIDDEITAELVRLVDREGDQLGVMGTDDALDIASARELHVVEVEAAADPPVCRLMSSDEIARRFGDDRSSGPDRPTVLREIRLQEPSDLDATVLHEARAHLARGDKLKITLRNIGRGADVQDAAEKTFDEIAQALDDIAIVEIPPERAGRDMAAFLAPR